MRFTRKTPIERAAAKDRRAKLRAERKRYKIEYAERAAMIRARANTGRA